MRQSRAFFTALFFCVAGLAAAQIVPSLPVLLQNNTLADANQVMANFNAIVNSVNANGAKNGINSDILALTALSTPLTPVQGGTSSYYAGAGGGTSNAQTTGAPVPAGFSLTAGAVVTFIAAAANNNVTTLNVNATGVKNIYRTIPNTIGPLGGGEITVGQLVRVMYDGTQYQLLNPAITNFPGTSLNFRGATSPIGYVFEDGTCYVRTVLPALFAVIGLTYGNCGGDPTLFPVPDSRGRLDAGRDDMGGSAAGRITNAGSGCVGTTLGLACGGQNHTMTVGELVAHTHTSPALTDPGHTHVVTINQQLFTAGAVNAYSQGGGAPASVGITVPTVTTGITLAATTGSTGSAAAMPILNPLLIANRIIRY